LNVLVFGAGVIGTVYASKLRQAGHSVTVLARGARLDDIRRHGLVVETVVDRRRSECRVDVTEDLTPRDRYDLILVAVRRDQLDASMASLAANSTVPTMLFMLNNPLGTSRLVETLGKDRIVLGFPGLGGTREGHVVRYALISQQPTTVGEVDGRRTSRLEELVDAFRAAQLPTRVERHMDAWLKAHAFFVTAVCGAIYRAGGDCRRLSSDTATLGLLVAGVAEGFGAIRATGLPVTPFSLKVLFTWLPRSFALRYWRQFFSQSTAEHVFGAHARSAAREMLDLARDCRALVETAGVEAVSWQRLSASIEAYALSSDGGADGPPPA
jgi:2-dehydropantoate 2-reductase